MVVPWANALIVFARHSKTTTRQAMAKIARKILMSPPVTLSGVVLIGVLEFVALQRSQVQAAVRGQLKN
jgi:hypothetical protein